MYREMYMYLYYMYVCIHIYIYIHTYIHGGLDSARAGAARLEVQRAGGPGGSELFYICLYSILYTIHYTIRYYTILYYAKQCSFLHGGAVGLAGARAEVRMIIHDSNVLLYIYIYIR